MYKQIRPSSIMDQVATSSRSNVDNGCTRDYTSEFTTTETFKSKQDLTNWAKKIGRSNDFTIVVLRSDSKKPRVTLGCERSGKCDSRSTKVKSKLTGSKKCGCPFRLEGKKLAAAGDEWQLEVVEGMHNHDAGHPGEGHSFQGRLSPEEKSLLKEMLKTEEKSLLKGMLKTAEQPKEILKALKERDERNKSTVRTILNEIQSLERTRELENKNSQLQSLMSKAEEYNFIEKHRTSPKRDTVLDFFVTHPTCLKLLLAFPTVLKIKLLCWQIPYTLDICGVTSTHIEFCVGTAFLFSKRKSTYEWALSSLRGVMNDYSIAMPDIVLFDIYLPREFQQAEALMKAIKDVFSTAKLLSDFFFNTLFDYTWNLSEFNTAERESFMEKWKLLEASGSKDDYEQRLRQLRTECHRYPEGVKYVIDTFLKPYKEMFAPALTDEVMHFGNTEVNYNWTPYYDILGYLTGSSKVLEQTEIDEIWEMMQGYIEGQHAEIKDSFRKSFEKSLENEYNGPSELKELHGAISTHALNLIIDEIKKATEIGDDNCSCAIRSTHGLTCAHEIAKYKRQGRPIPLACIHSYWKKLDLEPNVEGRMKRRRLSEQNSLSLPDIEESERNSLNAGPSIVPSTQERLPEDNEVYDIPTSKQHEFVDVCPLELRPWILEVKDVPRDGHCGFRAIASFMGYPEDDGWKKVRQDLTNELIIDNSHYDHLFGSERVNELRDALTYYEDICLQKKHRMTLPDMGHIIASCYNVVLMHLSSVQCFTFFPFKTEPTPSSISSTRVFVTGFDREHFYLQVYLKEGHPLPPPIPPPTKKRTHVAADQQRIYEQRSKGWVNLYFSRIEHFKSLQPQVVTQDNPVLLYIDGLSVENMDSFF